MTDRADLHVVPQDDLREHLLTIECWCCPLRDMTRRHVIVHRSMDGREAYETGERKPS